MPEEGLCYAKMRPEKQIGLEIYTLLLCRMVFLEGLGIGLATAVLIGPVFFTLLRAALQHGFRGGALVAFGIIVSDVVAAGLCLSGVTMVLKEPMSGRWFALLAAFLLAGTGVMYLLKTPRDEGEGAPLRRRDAAGLFVNGFLVNFVNPFVFAVWAAIVLRGTRGYGEGGARLLFLFAVLSGIFVSDLAKAWLAPRLKPLLAGRMLKRLYRLIGVALLVFGLRVLWYSFSAWH